MQEEKKTFFERNINAIQITIGVLAGIMLIFLALYIFTRPYWFESFDFTTTGEIGDTIGGITAPIINITGAILVYISFKAQITANRINFKALKDERESSNKESVFQKHISQYNDIKNRLDNIDFSIEEYRDPINYLARVKINFKGIDALNECINRVVDRHQRTNIYTSSYTAYSVLLNLNYILLSLNELTKSVDDKVEDLSDKSFLRSNLHSFYIHLIRVFSNKLIQEGNPADPLIIQIAKMQGLLDEKLIDV